ncbi:xanthine dehydrogenase family protein molybdopterin-binding subunit [Pendulispora albinea]|uniref:Xanthine dehydrogenase family protein molybdopterin-binding subunit n=1 Tax=Pendulispora albinea TaxID=2741071 RepID=A0ABZ2LV55_9BACT
MSASNVGKGIDRIDARLKVTGKAVFPAETGVANVAHAVVVTSTIARGRITTFDAREAERAPGVLSVMSHLNAPKLPGIDKKTSPNDRAHQLFQDDAVRFNDQPIAVVVADTLERARHAARLVVVRYAGSASTVDMTAELPRAYKPATSRFELDSNRGDREAGLAAAKVRVEQTYTTPTEHHNPMEPHAAIAIWHAGDRATLYVTTQGIFAVRDRFALLFGIPKENVRVISHYVGGGFGCKGSPWSYIAMAAMAAKLTGRGVKLVLSRQQMFSLVGHRSHTVQKVALGADANGKLTVIAHDVISATSRVDEFVEPAALQTRKLYACPNVSTSHRLVRLDIPTPTFTRAPGEAPGTFALESAMDELAYALGLDPIELRLRNYADEDPDEKKPWSSKSLRDCYRRGAEQFGWSRRTAAPRSMRDGRWLVGWGMATATYPAHQRAASAIARVRADGSALVQAGSQDIGTGTYTIMTQIAADALTLPLDQVRFELGDTALPETPNSGGSSTAASVGSAVKMAGLAVRKKLAEAAAADPRSPLHGLALDAIDAADGALFAKADRARRDPFAAIVARSGGREIVAKVDNREKADRKRYATHSFGAQFAEVKVDEELGVVRVSRFVGAFAAGTILNAKTAASQLQGGIIWGIGLALHEHTWRDERSGRIATRDLADYHVPVHADVPRIEIVTVDEVDPYVNEVGAKGVGEIGITGVGAAIANAVYHATGRRIRDLPITPDKLL